MSSLHPPHRLPSPFVAVLAVGLVNLVAELGIYGAWLVPRYGDAAHLPLGGWIAIYLPVFVVCAAVGRRFASWNEAIGAGLGAALVTHLEKFVLALAGAPGHRTGLVLTAPERFWTILLARIGVGFVLLFVLIHAVARRRD